MHEPSVSYALCEKERPSGRESKPPSKLALGDNRQQAPLSRPESTYGYEPPMENVPPRGSPVKATPIVARTVLSGMSML